jgi:hypothetical protein
MAERLNASILKSLQSLPHSDAARRESRLSLFTFSSSESVAALLTMSALIGGMGPIRFGF